MGAVVFAGLPRLFIWVELFLVWDLLLSKSIVKISGFDFLPISVTQVIFLTKLKKQRSQCSESAASTLVTSESNSVVLHHHPQGYLASSMTPLISSTAFKLLWELLNDARAEHISHFKCLQMDHIVSSDGGSIIAA